MERQAPPIAINPARIGLDEAYMQMAEIWAKRSKANRKQVGALIVKDKQIISDGYNGLPAGEADDVCEFWEMPEGLGTEAVMRTKPEVLHAESNAIAKLAENGGVGGQGATLYVTMSPCKECAKLIKQTKITRVVFREQYRDGGGIEFLLKRGVEVVHLPGEQSMARPLPAQDIVAQLRARQPVATPPPPPPPTAKPTPLMAQVAAVDLPPPLPPSLPPNAPIVGEDEVAALLRAHEAAQLAARAKAAGVAPEAVAPPDAPYRSSFA